VPRLSVLRTGQHLYAQVFSADGSTVLAAASTVQADVRNGLKNKNKDAAAKVGQLIAEGARLPASRSRVRPLGLPLSRPHQGPGRCCPRRWPEF
jgi:ribosomal protein L18